MKTKFKCHNCGSTVDVRLHVNESPDVVGQVDLLAQCDACNHEHEHCVEFSDFELIGGDDES